jgi:hypothetical protein
LCDSEKRRVNSGYLTLAAKDETVQARENSCKILC